jgi:predicted nucleic-acid-binding Zn-ribbon protein
MSNYYGYTCKECGKEFDSKDIETVQNESYEWFDVQCNSWTTKYICQNGCGHLELHVEEEVGLHDPNIQTVEVVGSRFVKNENNAGLH